MGCIESILWYAQKKSGQEETRKKNLAGITLTSSEVEPAR
jgi:hypothetical protein